MNFLAYWPADFVFALGVAVMFVVLFVLHLRGRINLIDCMTTRDKTGTVFTDPRKLIEIATWYVLTLGFVYIVVQDKLTEWYIAAYIGGATLTRFLRDREQRLNIMPEASRKQMADKEDRAKFEEGR